MTGIIRNRPHEGYQRVKKLRPAIKGLAETDKMKITTVFKPKIGLYEDAD